MSEFCKNCFLKIHPKLRPSDLIMVYEPELCEGCGKIVSETVLDIKTEALNRLSEVRNDE